MKTSLPNSGRPSCPCKLLPRSLSSFTAAEYGDLHSLTRLGRTVSQRRDEAGYTPLHFAAQQNHVAATALLLQLGCPVDGDAGRTGTPRHEYGTDRRPPVTCGATPLHRAAYSGAIAAMRVLLEWEKRGSGDDNNYITTTGQCNLLARDTSFWDESTPLHKAAAGGRYLAVHLLVEALRERRTTEDIVPTTVDSLDDSQGNPSDDVMGSSPRSRTMLALAISAVDRSGRTPLDVARHFFAIQDSERQAVARWDEVAGGVADWGKCIQLLEAAATTTAMEKDCAMQGGVEEDRLATQVTTTPTTASRETILPRLPSHLIRGVDACLDCNVDDSGGSCLTASWISEFQKALGGSVRKTLSAVSPCAARAIGTLAECQKVMDTTGETGDRVPGKESMTVSGQDPSTTAVAGASCSNCHKPTIVLYPSASRGDLVCKDCRRATRI
jgi:hypothetical protein